MVLEKIVTRKQTLEALKRKKLFTASDMAKLVPREYRDYTKIVMLKDALIGECSAVSGVLKSFSKKMMNKQNREYMTGRLVQADGEEFKVMFFTRVYMYEAFKECIGMPMVVCGKVTKDEKWGWQISEPDIFEPELTFTPKIARIYGKIAGVSEKMLGDIIFKCLTAERDPLENAVLDEFGIPDYKDSLYKLHYPNNMQEVAKGRKRLLYNDMLYFSMVLKGQNVKVGTETDIVFKHKRETASFIKSLPFELTDDQKSVVKALIQNSEAGKRNNILLQGDVGCGKTIVAAILMMCAAENGYQSVLMAPRQVLAAQHFEEIKSYAERSGKTIVFLHSNMKVRERGEALKGIADGSVDFIVGTHSCLTEDVEYKNLGLIVTDEEHLFGVKQKDALTEKAKKGVHQISMSATPIPRTMADVLYGGAKEVCTIKTKPAGRKDVITKATSKRAEVLDFMLGEIKAGHQCYVVCPAIENDEDGMLTSIEELEKDYRKFFEPKGFRVGVVNGKMKKADIAEVIEKYTKNEIQVLMSTTVIEVGVNVPNATVMAVEQAERFGLASLHQLRGRVGRSSMQSYCFLISEDEGNERLRTMVMTTDGFKIAEEDLRQRGSGNLIGVEQSGMNKYISQMLQYPKIYAKVSEIADYCLEHGYGKKLIDMYKEHEECLEQYRG